MIRRHLLAGVALLALAGCAAPEPPGTPPPDAPAEVAAVLSPASLEIPKLGVSSTLEPTGIDTNGGWEVPPLDRPEQASWFAPGPEPGDVGRPAVILGHVNGSGRPGVFARLGELAPGDEIVVTDRGGAARTFAVTRVQRAPKDEFEAVQREALDATTVPEIRLITCTGELEQRPSGQRGHSDNLIVYAAERA